MSSTQLKLNPNQEASVLTVSILRFDFPNHGLPQYLNNSAASTFIPVSPTPMSRPTAIRVFGKENGQPDMPAQYQPRRQVPVPYHVFPSQLFYDPTSNPLYAPAYAHSFGYLEQHTCSDNKPFSELASTFNGEFRQFNCNGRAPQLQGSPACDNNSGVGEVSGMNYAM